MTEKDRGCLQQAVVSTTGTDEKEEATITARKLPQYIAGLSATIGALASGLVIGWSSPAGNNGSNLDYSFEIDADLFSWLSSIATLGSATICIFIGTLTDLLGRRRAMLLGTIPFTIGWACVIWPNSAATLILGRFLLGMSGGLFCVAVPIYTAEIADPEIRGRLGSYYELLQCTGILAAYCLGLLHNMFLLSLISASVPIIFFAVFFFMPESPTYYLMKGNVEAARNSLIWLRGSKPSIVEPELVEQINSLAEAERNKVSFLVAIRSKAAVKGLVIGYGLMLFQQLSGINAIIFYGTSIFSSSGDDSDRATIIVGTAIVAAVFMSTLLIDKWGRRVILFISSAIMFLTHLFLGIYFYMDYMKKPLDGWTWVPLVCICAFVVAMEFGFGPIPWLMIGEIFSPRIRGVAGSSASCLNWIMAFLVTKFYNDLNILVKAHGTFWIFSGICGLAIVFVALYVPETKGKTLDQIQIELGGDSRNCNVNKEIKTKV